jgi:hypothetical protein
VSLSVTHEGCKRVQDGEDTAKTIFDAPDFSRRNALKAPDIAALAADDGPLQLTLSGEQDFAEITHPDYPGERLVCYRNPALAESGRLKREALLAATEADLGKIRAPAAAGRLKDTDKIGIRVGKVIGKHPEAALPNRHVPLGQPPDQH